MPINLLLVVNIIITIIQAYIEWLNDQLPESEVVNNISQSLADGTLILKALSVSCLASVWFMPLGIVVPRIGTQVCNPCTQEAHCYY